MRVFIGPGAEADIQEAAEWYEKQERGVGKKFLNELRSVLIRIQGMPRQFPVVDKNHPTDPRRALFPRFPYAIYFVLNQEQKATVLAVLHQHQHPETWKKRAPSKRGPR